MKLTGSSKTSSDPIFRGIGLHPKLALLSLFGLEIAAPGQLPGAAGSIPSPSGNGPILDGNTDSFKGMLIPKEDQKEIKRLRKQARRLNWYLLGFTLLSLVGTVLFCALAADPGAIRNWIGIVACIAAGTMGSAVAALLSSQERRANGWEVANGKKYPEPTPEDKFNASMVPRFYSRPFLGSVVGAVFYLGVPNVLNLDPSKQPDLQTLAFWSFVVGVMAKTFLETLKDLFKFKKLGHSHPTTQGG